MIIGCKRKVVKVVKEWSAVIGEGNDKRTVIKCIAAENKPEGWEFGERESKAVYDVISSEWQFRTGSNGILIE